MICDDCGSEITIGEWPYCPHGRSYSRKGFEPYFDENICTGGAMITNPGDRNKLMRPYWEKDHYVHVQERGKSEAYYRELNQRRAHRAEMERKRNAG